MHNCVLKKHLTRGGRLLEKILKRGHLIEALQYVTTLLIL